MTIFFPDNVSGFRQAFDETCERIMNSDQDTSFYTLLAEMMISLKAHSLPADFIKEVESSILAKKKDFSLTALEAVEDQWKRLWKYHAHRLKYRKSLAIIKRIVTGPTGIVFTPLYERLRFNLRQFCHFSHLFRLLDDAPRLFRSAQFEIQYGGTRSTRFLSEHEMSKIPKTLRTFTLLKLKKKDKRQKLRNYIQFQPTFRTNSSFNWKAEELPAALFSPKVIALERRFLIPKVKQNLLYLAETDPSICWERLCFVCDCIATQGTFPSFSLIRGDWEVIREQAWEAAMARCDREALLGANMSFNQKMTSIGESLIDVFIKPEHEIDRKAVEKYLQSLKNHLHAYLFKFENEHQPPPYSPELDLPGTQKGNFVIDLAKRFWKKNPNGNYDAAFDYYLLYCPFKKQLKRDRWNQIIREKDLDPRNKSEKTRGPGKKTCKK